MFFLEDVVSPHFVLDAHQEETLCFDSTREAPCPFAEHNNSTGAPHKEAHFGHVQFVLAKLNLTFTKDLHLFSKAFGYQFILKTNFPKVPKLPPIVA